MNRKWIGLAIWLAVPLAAGGAGAVPTIRAIPGWYRTLKKPSWTPPDRVFGPVWNVLYLMMGVAAWLVWRADRDDEQKRVALELFGIQLAFNTLWSLIFFGLRSPGLALVEIVVLWRLILETAIWFYGVRPLAGLLLLPYLLWTTFATGLNAAIWWLNRR
jgi:translocator protein